MRIFLGGHLNYYQADKSRWLNVNLLEPTRLVDILHSANIPRGEIYLVVLNGSLTDLQGAIVTAGDEIKLFSPIGGG